jgi:hypothetical protein
VRISELISRLERVRQMVGDVELVEHNHCRKCGREPVEVVIGYDGENVSVDLTFDEGE